MGAPSKRARKIRKAAEFDVPRISRALAPPSEANGVFSWTLANIYDARNAQMRGSFAMPAKLATAMRTDDAIAVARANRLAPLRCISVGLVPGRGAGASKIAREAEALYGEGGIALSGETESNIAGCLLDHGLAFAINVATLRPDGSRLDLEVRYWPIEYVRWDAYYQCFFTRIDPSSSDADSDGARMHEVPIVHGDGRWIIFQAYAFEPFRQEPTIMAAALVWARHAFALRDWAKSSVAHGSAKVIGEMPEGVPLQVDGALSPEAEAYVALLRSYASDDSPVGIQPSGAKTQFVSNNSTAWQVFSELILNAERAAARIYLGTDGTLGSQGGAPGVDVTALFGVARTKIQGDVDVISRGLDTGSIQVWCAVNFGDSSLSPKRAYLLPDTDADAARASMASRVEAFYAEIEKTRANGFQLTQDYVDAIAARYGIDAPALPKETNKAPTIALAPTDLARVVTVNEARASAGVGPLTKPDGTPDPDGRLTVEQFSAKASALLAPQQDPLRSMRK